MKTYLVGGAVRDQHLGLPVTEQDWVVVGGTPEAMLAKGFKKVGRDFPVFLHPKTRQEYALARQERKVGVGYHGFACVFDKTVTLEDDLLRRDLTINAMAQDERGNLIDPYGGAEDLKRKQLRHVSEAFCEDPLRVLRVARFKAKFHHLGFDIASETLSLMRKMVRDGELCALTPERVWQEWEKSLKTASPAQFILTLRQVGALAVLLPELDALFGVPAKPLYHPEIDTGIHMCQVAALLSHQGASPEAIFSALLHDVGKGATDKTLWPSHPHHDETGLTRLNALCDRFKVPNLYRRLALLVAAQHLKIHAAHTLPAEQVLEVLCSSGGFQSEARFECLLQVSEADVKACCAERDYVQSSFWLDCLATCRAISTQAWTEQGYSGPQIQAALKQARLDAIETVKKSAEQA